MKEGKKKEGKNGWCAKKGSNGPIVNSVSCSRSEAELNSAKSQGHVRCWSKVVDRLPIDDQYRVVASGGSSLK